ncbi:nucleotide sugar dehydrogenase [Helicobacter himalayensis]|uniref:nucleotide sugar dehydrogenase n=1 Tax=Helicobacter himalayensis TaxID=1591088 RepID=UPI003D701182
MAWWSSLANIAVLGLGYVGYPLARAFAKSHFVIAFDIDKKRIKELQSGFERNTNASFLQDKNLHFTHNPQELKKAEVFIIAVPTPIHKDKSPNLSFLFHASELVGKVLKKNDLVVFESTTYPFCTSGECAQILCENTTLKEGRDFFIAYSPERINPADSKHTLENTTKLIATNTKAVQKRLKSLYESVTDTYLAPSIEVAEMAKLIENVQRDLNIAFINEVAIMCDRLGLSASEVLSAAKTKWNFLPFNPGLVGGHCISVDPYYLAFILKRFSYKSKILDSARSVNNVMSKFLAQKITHLSKELDFPKNARVLILGLSFKENCPDMRNSKIPALRKKLKKNGFKVKVYDPLIDRESAKAMFGFSTLKSVEGKKFDIIMLINAHNEFLELDIRALLKDSQKNIVFDLKNVLPYATHRL